MTLSLVTGASGFIGSHLVDGLLQRGHRVRCLLRRSSSRAYLPTDRIECVEGDVTDAASVADAVAGCDRVYHVAGLTCALSERELLRVNREGTWQIATACAAQPTPPTLLYLSSIAAAGPIARDQVRTEDDPPAPMSQYGRSKRAGEEALHPWSDRVPITVIRPGVVFGPRDRQLLPIFRSVARFRLHAYVAPYSPPLSYIYVADLVELMLRAVECGNRLAGGGNGPTGASRGYYFATVDEFPDYREFGRMIARTLNHAFFVPLPLLPPFPWAIAGLNEVFAQWRGRADSFNRDKIREASVTSWACSGSRAERELGFQPGAKLFERLVATTNWYRQQGWL